MFSIYTLFKAKILTKSFKSTPRLKWAHKFDCLGATGDLDYAGQAVWSYAMREPAPLST